jgi:homoserine/homoserine lactone efflux protein
MSHLKLYLGIQLLQSAFSKSEATVAPATPVAASRSLIGGFALHAANPKALLYFGSLVPQFVDPTHPLAMQLTVLAFVHLSTAAVVLFMYAAISSHFRNSAVSGRASRAFKAVAGSSFIGAGVSMVLFRRSAE